MKPQKCGIILKPNILSTWEAIIPDGKGCGFNVQTWSNTSRKYLQLITELSDENFMKIVKETECYMKISTKGKDKTAVSILDEEDSAMDFYDFC